jgi:hypothetical protein
MVDANPMRQLILGAVLAIWGLGLVVSGFVQDTSGDGAYAAGQLAAWIFGFVMLAAGVRAVVKARAARG